MNRFFNKYYCTKVEVCSETRLQQCVSLVCGWESNNLFVLFQRYHPGSSYWFLPSQGKRGAGELQQCQNGNSFAHKRYI